MEFGMKMRAMLTEGLEQIGEEVSRLGIQGTAELGSAIFNGSAYTPYGQGQTRGAVHGLQNEGQTGMEQDGKEEMQQENDGRSM